MSPRRLLLALVSALLLVLVPTAASAHHPGPDRTPTLLVTGLSGGWGSEVGPDGALYVTSPAAGVISRVDPRTGAVTTFASGFPSNNGSGVTDVTFLHGTAYALVTFVAPEVGGTGVNGIYRIDGPTTATLVADLGAFAAANPPPTDFFVATGVQYAFDTSRGGFLVTDGHHNRVYRVGLDGSIAVQITFDNIVPTGIDVHGRTVYMAEAGPLPHLAADGKVVTFGTWSDSATVLAAGGPLMVDVKVERGRVYALAQGDWPLGGQAGSPAAPDTGRLLVANRHGGFDVLASGLDQPVSFQVLRGTAYVVTLTGEVWTVRLGGHH